MRLSSGTPTLGIGRRVAVQQTAGASPMGDPVQRTKFEVAALQFSCTTRVDPGAEFGPTLDQCLMGKVDLPIVDAPDCKEAMVSEHSQGAVKRARIVGRATQGADKLLLARIRRRRKIRRAMACCDGGRIARVASALRARATVIPLCVSVPSRVYALNESRRCVMDSHSSTIVSCNSGRTPGSSAASTSSRSSRPPSRWGCSRHGLRTLAEMRALARLDGLLLVA